MHRGMGVAVCTLAAALVAGCGGTTSSTTATSSAATASSDTGSSSTASTPGGATTSRVAHTSPPGSGWTGMGRCTTPVSLLKLPYGVLGLLGLR